jgi:VWFA-related protein
MKLPALFAALVGLVLSQDPQTPPIFKSGVDVVRVDVSVLDKTGLPVGDLSAGDFTLQVDGKPRRIASVQFISLTRHTTEAPTVPMNYASNTAALGGRLIALAIDQGNIGAGTGKQAIDAARRFVATLNRSDRLALYTIPGAGPRVDFTVNHAVVNRLLDGVVGTAVQNVGPHNIGVSEVFGLERNDHRTITTLIDRECPGFRTVEEVAECQRQLAGEARALGSEIRARTRDSLLGLRAVMERLAAVSGPKTLVLLSEGFFIERRLSEVEWVAPLAARGQLSLYVLQIEPPLFEASNPRLSATRIADIDLAQDGLGYLTGLAKGDVFRVTSGADFAFSRISRELSGYYLLSFDPEPADRDGRSHQIRIAVPNRRDLLVRARSEFSVTAAGPKTSAEMLAEAIRSPLLATEIPMKVAVYNFWDREAKKIRVMMATEINRSLNRRAALSAGYAVMDAKGGLVATDIEPVLATPISDRGAQAYVAATLVNPGIHTLKVAVHDDSGKQGSVEYTFDARIEALGQIRMGGLLLAARENDTGPVRPAVDTEFSSDLLHAYLELYADAPEPLANASVMVEVVPRDGARAVDSAPVRFQDAKDAGHTRVGEATVTIGLLPPGEYDVRAIVAIGGREAGRVTRPFRIVAKK